jgi:anhydro-N-acetylmuramic acid kinase
VASFIGLMSGTSLDGVDGVLADIDAGITAVRAHVHLPMPADMATELLALNQPGSNELHRAALAGNAVSRLYAQAARQLLARAGASTAAISAIGAHGQTVRHRPGEFDGTGYTLQLINGALLAELAGIDVVCDLRSRDVAAGGQGAPLVPAFHAERFGRAGRDVAVLNLGGIANLTLLPADGKVLGFDCGPANALMDLWCRRHTGQPYDEGGRWAAGGQVNAALLSAWLADPFFSRPPPKSTGRDLFNADWLDAQLPVGLAPEDVMSTLAALTVHAAIDALHEHAPATSRLLVCGGGAYNDHLMRVLAESLARKCPQAELASTAAAGIAPEQVEALAFAWLAWRFRVQQPGNLPSVTGARGARLLGALYPA